ncbi:MAG: PUR family DNA/RNA-binding protein [Armatimonadetes bacterium]|nr:PUR family DNA/RNA-binding protein [Armatimonadota bacterium]
MEERLRRTIFNAHVVAGKRHYFFDVKENERGERYLVITESQPSSESTYSRQRVMVYQEHLDAFLSGLRDAIKAMRR